MQLHHLGIGTDEAHLFQRLANRVLYSDPTLRPPPDVLARNTVGQLALWPYGISGDLPIVLVRIDEPRIARSCASCLRAHEYWRTKRLAVDLVILNEQGTSYAQDLQDVAGGAACGRARRHQQHDGFESRGAIFILRADRIPPADRILLQMPHVPCYSAGGARSPSRSNGYPHPEVAHSAGDARGADSRRRRREAGPAADLEFFNGLGGFAAGGREYVHVSAKGSGRPRRGST